MRLAAAITAVLALLLTAALVLTRSHPVYQNNAALISAIGVLYTTAALVFSILAAVWAKEAKEVISAYVCEFLELSPEQREVFALIARSSDGGRKPVTRSQMGTMEGSIIDWQRHVDRLVQKGWLTEEQGLVGIATKYRVLARQLMSGG